jgi:hypothetical protein
MTDDLNGGRSGCDEIDLNSSRHHLTLALER